MKKFLKVALIGLALGATAGVASATVGSEDTTARPCCSSCEDNYPICIDECAGEAACIAACDRLYNRCYATCSTSC